MKSVLVVDDDPDILTATSDAFECGGYAVLGAGSGEDALRVLSERDDIGLVLLDVQMPGLTGLEVITIASRDLRLCKIPFVLMTAAFQVEPPGGVLLLRKPFSLIELLCLAVEHIGGACPRHTIANCLACNDSPRCMSRPATSAAH